MLELGCGTGITGIVTGALGAKLCVLTDIDIIVDKIVPHNVILNAGLYSTKHSPPRVVAMKCNWGADFLASD